MRIAVYARVSTGRQEREHTIASQLAALRSWAQEQGHDLLPEHSYADEGYSGAWLDRPALDRLRDAAHEGAFTLVAVWSPDRLARNYAYQHFSPSARLCFRHNTRRAYWLPGLLGCGCCGRDRFGPSYAARASSPGR